MAIREKMQRYIANIYGRQEEKVRRTLDQITDEKRNLLALRGYVRFPGRVADRWAWTEEEAENFEGSAADRLMEGEIRGIRRRFARNNPGYQLRTNTNPRSLEEQLRLWNSTRGTGGIVVLSFGQRLWNFAEIELNRTIGGREVYPSLEPRHDLHHAILSPAPAATAQFSAWLAQHSRDLGLPHRVADNWRVNPSLATPGISKHGQKRAIDFIVKRGGEEVVGAHSGQAELNLWRGNPHWQNLLNDAITAQSGNWRGPLRSPDEPWHYDYEG